MQVILHRNGVRRRAWRRCFVSYQYEIFVLAVLVLCCNSRLEGVLLTPRSRSRRRPIPELGECEKLDMQIRYSSFDDYGVFVVVNSQ
jgi:hypothetical protein